MQKNVSPGHGVFVQSFSHSIQIMKVSFQHCYRSGNFGRFFWCFHFLQKNTSDLGDQLHDELEERAGLLCGDSQLLPGPHFLPGSTDNIQIIITRTETNATVPVVIFFAHFGSEFTNADPNHSSVTVVLIWFLNIWWNLSTTLSMVGLTRTPSCFTICRRIVTSRGISLNPAPVKR